MSHISLRWIKEQKSKILAKNYLLLFLAKFLRLSGAGGNIAEMTSHGFNKLCIVKAFNRKMKIHIAWQSRKNRMLV